MLDPELEKGGIGHMMSGSPTHSDHFPAGSDAELADRIRAGGAEAMNELLRRYWAGVVEYAERYMGDRDEAEDVGQETFLRFWEGRVSWTRSGSLKAFLYGVARNVARNRGREWQQVRFITLDEDTASTAASARPGPDDLASQAERARHLYAAVTALPPRRQEVFILARFHDLAHDEIAAILGISAQTVANQVSAALSDLRRALGPLLRQPS